MYRPIICHLLYILYLLYIPLCITQAYITYWESFAEETFHESPSLTQFTRKYSWNDQFFVCLITRYIRLPTLFSQIPSWEGSNIHRPTAINALANSHIEQTSLHGWLPLHVASHIQTILSCFSAATNNGKSGLVTQGYTSLALLLANSY